MFKFLASWIMYCAAAMSQAATIGAPIDIKIAATAVEIEAFEAWNKDVPYRNIAQYNRPNTPHGTIDLILQLKALEQGGVKIGNIEFDTYPITLRTLTAVTNGKVHLMSQAYWTADLSKQKDNLHITVPIIKNGEYQKGIYALPSNTNILKIASLPELKKFQPVIVSSWEKDIYTLNTVPFDRVLPAANKETLYRMLHIGRADFTLLEFSSADDLSHIFEGIRLVPVPNLKISIIGSRAFSVSKTMDPNAQLYRALEKGLSKMLDEGEVQRAYEESGFFSPQVKNWQRIY